MTETTPTESRWGTILDAVARVADRIHAAPSVRDAMPEVLAILGRATQVSRVYVFEHIPHSQHDTRMRQPFTTRDATQGTGLGLATVYGAVSAASGSLRLTSAPGQGTELRVYLPVAGPASVAPPAG